MAMTADQVEEAIRRIDQRNDALTKQTEDQINAKLAAVPETVKNAIERARVKEILPQRPNMGGGGSEVLKEGMWRGGYSAADPEEASRLRDGYRMDNWPSVWGSSPQEKRIRLMRQLGRYSPASRAYADGKPEEDFRGMGDFIRDVYQAKPGNQFRGVSPRLKASFAEGSGDTGGFLLREDYRAELMALEIEGSEFQPRATAIPMTTMRISVPTIRDTTHVGSVFGGLTGFWEPEAGQLSESEPVFGQAQLEAHKLTLYTVASNEIVADGAIGLEAIIRQRFPQASTWLKETAFWNGDGGGMPEGLLNCAALIAQAKETNQVASTILTENIVNMYSHMLPNSHKNAVWFCHPNVLPQLFTMSLSVGTGGGPIFVQFGGMQQGFPMSIFGRPLIPTEHLAGLGSQGDIVYADLSYYLIGTRQDLAMDASPHVKFVNDQTVWRFIERLDGRPWIDSDLTLEHGSFHVSPFVTLAARS